MADRGLKTTATFGGRSATKDKNQTLRKGRDNSLRLDTD